MPQPYEWAVLRVVPRVERGEFVNAGVLVYCRALDFLAAQVVRRPGAGRALDPQPRRRRGRAGTCRRAWPCARANRPPGVNGRRSAGERFRWLVAPRSTVVQPSPVHTGLTEDPADELAELFDRMVDPGAHPGRPR